MIKAAIAGIILAAAWSAAALAACPPAAMGDTPAAIQANGQRLVCLQNEVAAATRQRQYELQLKQITQSLQNLELRSASTLCHKYRPTSRRALNSARRYPNNTLRRMPQGDLSWELQFHSAPLSFHLGSRVG